MAATSMAFAHEDGALTDPVVSGRMVFTALTSGGGRIIVEVRQEGSRILGRTNFGPDSSINLRVNPGVSYQGSAAGGYTELSCTDVGCQGQIGDKSARFTITPTGQRGTVNLNRLSVTRSAGNIVIDSLGAVELAESSPGQYYGRGFLNSSPNSAIRAELETSGTLLGLEDPALLTILVASVLTGSQ